jgi:hypothetical protein
LEAREWLKDSLKRCPALRKAVRSTSQKKALPAPPKVRTAGNVKPFEFPLNEQQCGDSEAQMAFDLGLQISVDYKLIVNVAVGEIVSMGTFREAEMLRTSNSATQMYEGGRPVQ